MAVDQTKQLSERFEAAFNQIHSWLKKNSKPADTDKFTELLRSAFPRYSFIRKYYHDLKMFARLRNSIVHNKIEVGYYIAEPHEEIVKQIEEINSLILEEKEALSIATQPVFFYYEDAKLSDVLTVIQKLNYSIFPVYNDDGFHWLLTNEDIIIWLADHMVDSNIDLKEVLVKDLFSLKKNRPVEFVAKSTDIYEVEEIFERYVSKKQKLAAVIITENAKQSEKPLGIVTSWDLVEIE